MGLDCGGSWLKAGLYDREGRVFVIRLQGTSDRAATTATAVARMASSRPGASLSFVSFFMLG